MVRISYKSEVPQYMWERELRGECPSCGKHKDNWDRRTDWRCCSKECTQKYVDNIIVTDWQDIRKKTLKRDNYKCVKCGEKNQPLEVDHIKPISLGGEEFDMNNTQTLCSNCHKEKTKQDLKKLKCQNKTKEKDLEKYIRRDKNVEV